MNSSKLIITRRSMVVSLPFSKGSLDNPMVAFESKDYISFLFVKPFLGATTFRQLAILSNGIKLLTILN
jgi:hypothetical protein